jgi:hypothetical protein
MDISKFKYRASFSSVIKTIIPAEYDKFLATASLKSLHGVFPPGLNPEDSPDLLYVVANGAVGNLCNKNADCISNADIVKIAPFSINKYLTVEHKRTEGAVGAISNFGFSKYGSNELMTAEEAIASNDPVNWVVGGFIWKILDENLANLVIESSDENSLRSNTVSYSWEVLFSDYHIMVGSQNLSEAKIITDKDEIEKLNPCLRANNGSGFNQTKEPIYRLIVGEMLPVGFSLTKNPAAHVQGVSVLEDKPTPKQQEEIIINLKANENLVTCAACNKPFDYNSVSESSMGAVHCPNCDCTLDQEGKVLKASDSQTNIIESLTIELAVAKEKLDKFEQNDKNISLSQKNSVNDNIKKNPDNDLTSKNKIKSNKMIKLKFNDSDKEVLETAASTDVYEIAKELNKKMTEYSAELDVKAAEAKTAQEASAKLKEDSAALAADLEKVKLELKNLNEVRAQEKVQADFSVRMADLNEKFELDADKSKSIAADIRGLDDESFASWLAKMQPFLVAKKFVPFEKKGDKVDDSEPDEDGDDEEMKKEKKAKAKKECKASILEQIADLKPFGEKIVNKVAEGTKSVADLFAEAFADLSEDKEKNKAK